MVIWSPVQAEAEYAVEGAHLPLRIAIVDGEAQDLQRTERLLRQVGGVEVVARATTISEALSSIERTMPDLVLTESMLRDGTGFDLTAAFTSSFAPLIAFITSNPRYAVRAFEISAAGYLLKPTDPEQLSSVLERVRSLRALDGARDRITELERAVRCLREQAFDNDGPGYLSEIWIREKGTDHIRVPVEAIDWIDAQDDYACIHAFGRGYMLRASLHRLARNLNPREFARIHRSTVVRIDRVEEIRHVQPRRYEAILKDKTRLPIGRTYAPKLPWRSRLD